VHEGVVGGEVESSSELFKGTAGDSAEWRDVLGGKGRAGRE